MDEYAAEPDEAGIRRRLKYPWLAKKVAPPGYIEIDEALHRIGSRLFPDEWCATPIWDEMPVTYSKKKKQYRKTVLNISHNDRSKKLKYVPLANEYEYSEIKSASKCFVSAARYLFKLVSCNKLRFIMIKSGSLQIIEGSAYNMNPFFAGYRSVLRSGYFLGLMVVEGRRITDY